MELVFIFNAIFNPSVEKALENRFTISFPLNPGYVFELIYTSCIYFLSLSEFKFILILFYFLDLYFYATENLFVFFAIICNFVAHKRLAQ